MRLAYVFAKLMLSRCCRLVHLISMCIIVLTAVPCLHSGSSRLERGYGERLQKEAPPAWEKYHSRIKSLQFAVRVSSRNKEAQLTYLKRAVLTCFDNRIMRTVEQELPRDRRGLRRVVVNPEYAFEVEQSRKQDGWRLVSIIPGDEIEQLPLPWNPKEKALTYYRAAYVPFWASIYDTLTHPNFSIQRVAYVDEAKGQHLRIEFEHTFHTPSGDVRKQGWLVLDPDKYWVIIEGKVSNDWAISHAKLEYQDTPDGFPLLQRIERISSYPQLGELDISKWEFEYWEKKPVRGEEEFRLSYYGIPEPEELRGHKFTPWWLYILLAGLALVIVGFGIYAWRRHRRAALA